LINLIDKRGRESQFQAIFRRFWSNLKILQKKDETDAGKGTGRGVGDNLKFLEFSKDSNWRRL